MPGRGGVRAWTRVGADEPRYDGGHLRVVRRRLRRADGAESDWDLLDSVDSVVVLPLTGDGRVVCIRGYRPGPDAVVTCLPGGLLAPGETPEHAAARELREETGWEAADLRLVGRSQWFKSTERTWSVVARGVRRTGPAAPDPEEDLEVVLLGLAEVRSGLRDGSFGTVAPAYQALDAAGLL